MENPEESTAVYPDLWPGISLTYKAKTSGGIVKSSYELAPGSDPGAIALRANVPVQTDRDGRLHYAFETGEMIESKPAAWQEIDGRRVEIAVSYRTDGGKEYGFRVGEYDRALPLVIDPVLTWNTFLGRAESTVDEARAVAFDGASAIYVCGTSDGPWGSPVLDYAGGVSDAYVVKFNTSGARQWITFLGGPSQDRGMGVAVDGTGIYVSGSSEAAWGSPRRLFSSGRDAFVAKLNTSGALQWNTFLGGSGFDEGRGIAVDGAGVSYVTGGSEASWGSPIIRNFSSGRDAFVAKLSSSGVLTWTTFLGGSSYDTGNDICFTTLTGGSVYVAGDSQATWGSPVRGYSGSQDGFAAYLNTSGAVQWNTFLGGTDTDSGEGLVASTTGAVYITGTSSAAWGTSPARAFSTGPDAYAAMIHPAGALAWHTFLGGSGSDSGRDISIDGGGNAYVTGTSGASWGEPEQGFQGNTDGFAVKLNLLAGALTWNTFLGSDQADEAAGIVHTASGACGIIGTSAAGPWPAGIPVSAYAGDKDGFLEIVDANGALSAYTFMGGLGYDEAKAIDVDASGNIYVAGTSRKTWGAPVRAFSGTQSDAFVAKLSSSGVLAWNTFLGGNGDDQGAAIAVTAGGVVYASGLSSSAWGSPVRGYAGAQDAFAAKLNANGSLQWNTFLGGSGGDYGNGLAVDGDGNAYVVGYSPSGWGSPIRSYTGSNDAFAAKLNASGALLWHTFLGGASGSEIGYGIAVDGSGNSYVAGTGTASWGSPVRNFTSSLDGFAAELNAGGALQWNTFLGGSNSDGANAVAVFGTEAIFVTGISRTTWGSPLQPHPGYFNGYAAKLNGSGALQWHTFFGSASAYVEGRSADVDAFGNLYVGGLSSGTWGTPFRTHSGGDDLFAAMFETNGTLVWNGFFGSPGAETYGGLAAGGGGDVSIAGTGTQTWGSPDVGYGGGTDAFAARITNELPPTVTVTAPNGGETWGQGTVQDIVWVPTGVLANVKIDYSANGGSNWTQIAASAPNTGTYAWTLPVIVSSNCLVRISAAGGGAPTDQSDAAFTITDQVPTISLSKTSFHFGAERYGTPTPGQTTILRNSGEGALAWTATPLADWISVTPDSGTGDSVLTITVNRTNHNPGVYNGEIRIAAGGASNTPQTIAVSLNVVEEGSDAAPFGDYATPADGATVRSSIAVTGWVLDDVHVVSVKIYRGTGLSDRIYIGDATLVRGARPDVEAAYPAYPENDLAGWGYMLLTNFLPNGNGAFSILAYASDSKGHEAFLGAKSILVDNAGAVNPFGAIDTPAQGGTASGNPYYNFGWALTPLPDSIPIDGSTILVWIDSLPLGHPDYNHYRADIAGLFPGYVNSNGAVGFYLLNTEAMADGVHTIAWSVQDSGGDIDGIGSRYFTVANLSGGSNLEYGTTAVSGIPDDRWTPVYIRRGVRDDAPAEMVVPDGEGSRRIDVPLLSRIAVYFDPESSRETRAALQEKAGRILFDREEGRGSDPGRYEAWQSVSGERRPLPTGSSFDSREGVLYWQPGPGFYGEFEMVIIRKSGAGSTRKTIKLRVIEGEGK